MRVPLLLSLGLLGLLALPGRGAGPPEAVSGRMVLDEVAEGLRRYHKEPDAGKRMAWLRRLAPFHDPRVALELWELFAGVRGKRTDPVRNVARDCLAEYYVTREGRPLSEVAPADSGRAAGVCGWWARSGADVRRRAKELPR